jgi:heme a synthase
MQRSTLNAQRSTLNYESELDDRPRYHPWLHRIALLTTIATFPLIFMGGLVTSHQAGMSVPDWPNSYGYNMFLFPPRLWIGGILYEHTHRLMGTVVGMCAIALTIIAWRTEERGWSRWLATSVLGAVIFQGILGGMRVVLVKLDLAIVHACVAQAFFCLATFTAIVTSRWWHSTTHTAGQSAAVLRAAPARILVALSILAVLTVYLQLIIGATMRHYQAGLAIPDLPLAYGHLLPSTTQAQLDAINHQRAWNMNLNPVTLGQIWLHYAHRVGAIFVTAVLLTLVAFILKRHRDALMVPALILTVLLLAQLTLGVLTVYFRKPADIASLHVAVGALVLVTTFAIAVVAIRLYSLSRSFAQEEKTMDPQMNADARRSDNGVFEPVLSA